MDTPTSGGIWLDQNRSFVFKMPDGLSGVSLMMGAADWRARSFKLVLDPLLESAAALIEEAEGLDG